MAFWNWLRGGNQRSDGGAQAPGRAAPIYSIETAIELMRSLPVDDNPALVLRVVRKTLRSFGVSIEEIIRAATNRESDLSGAIVQDRAAIEQLERDIAVRKASIDKTTAQLDETRIVRERLQDALQTETKIQTAFPQEEIASLQAEARQVQAAADEKAPSAAQKLGGLGAYAKSTPPPLPKRPALPTPRREPVAAAEESAKSLPSLSDLSDALEPTKDDLPLTEEGQRKSKA